MTRSISCCFICWVSLVIVAVTGKCYDSIQEIDKQEALVNDYSVLRKYILCKDTTFQIGSFHSYYGALPNADSTMLHLRPNIHIRCGDSGSQSNNCQLVGGDVQLEGTERFGVKHKSPLYGVVLEGVTFRAPKRHMVFLDQPGDVLFLNCAFSGATNAQLPVHLDFFGPSRDELLHVRFRGCSFKDNSFSGFPSQPAIIVGNGPQNRITVTDSTFEANDMATNNRKVASIGSLIETQGPIDLFRNCFLNNKVGLSLVTVYQSPVSALDNFEDVTTNGRTCDFTASFLTSTSYEKMKPVCTTFDSSACARTNVDFRTANPVSTPTEFPTVEPTVSPSSQPTTLSPTLSPTLAPSTLAPSTLQPTVSPTSLPTTRKPTGAPSFLPTPSPTRIVIESQEETTSFGSITAQSRGIRQVSFLTAVSFVGLLMVLLL